MNVARIHRTRYSILLVSGSKPGSVQAQRPNKQSSSAREHRWSSHNRMQAELGLLYVPFNPSVSIVPVTANSSIESTGKSGRLSVSRVLWGQKVTKSHGHKAANVRQEK